ncbi:MAG: hypothetical protein AAFX51_14655 [Cyanobacteria bacterium J06636_28]
MILSRISPRGRAVRINPCWTWVKPLYLLLLLGMSACGPKRSDIPDGVEAIAHRCYETLAAPGRTPQLNPSQAMGDGTFLIVWSMAEFPDERGSCTVDGSGAVLLLTSADEQSQPEETSTP